MEDLTKDFKVTDRQTFVNFLEELHKDLINNPENWRNKILLNFLEALASYSEDIQGFYDNTEQNINADKADWSTLADMFKGATIYE